MPFIWNDKTYWDRYKQSTKIQLIFFTPLIVISLILWFLFTDLGVIKTFILAFFTALTIFTFLDIFLKFPNDGIPDNYHKSIQMLFRIVYFVASSIFLFVLIKKYGIM
jgi:multisubunit Na+/H+ antiporter MnhE subunit